MLDPPTGGRDQSGITAEVSRFEQMHERRREKELDGEQWTFADEANYQEWLAYDEDEPEAG